VVNDLEYLVGSSVTIILLVFSLFLIRLSNKYNYPIKVKSSQSRTHQLMAPVTINIYPEKQGDNFIEFDSIMNLKPKC
jgi:hypothetical protein